MTFSVLDVSSREEALNWAAKIAATCCCAQRYGSSCPTRRRSRAPV